LLNWGGTKTLLPISVAAILAFVLTVSGVWLPLERWLYDKTIGLLAFGDPTGEGYVRVVAIDDASLNKVGPWPWPRSILAEVLEHIAKAGARVIVLDVLLAEATPDDGSLAMAMDSAPVILPYNTAGVHHLEAGGGFPASIFPNQRFLPHVVSGHGEVLLDSDGVVRRVPILLDGGGKLKLPMEIALIDRGISPLPVSVEAVRQFLAAQQGPQEEYGTEMALVRVESSALKMGLVSHPLDGKGNLLLRYPPGGRNPSIWPQDEIYSAAAILEGRVSSHHLKGKIVFIGGTATGIPDRHVTPLVHQGPIPGVFLHAATARALLAGNTIGILPTSAIWAIACALVLFQIGYVYRREPLPGLILTMLSLVVLAASYLWAVFCWQRWFPVVSLANTTVIFHIFGLVHQYAVAKEAKRQMADSLRRYFSPLVLEEILSEKKDLATREVEGTVLFADLSGFTGLAETLPPLTVVSVLNRHLSRLVEMVFRYGGTLDKFTGDGIMAFFGAPLPDPKHRESAIAAAWDMQRHLANLPKVEVMGYEVATLKLAVGIATGRFVVGNIGAGDRFDYTAIGDVVNTAARLEQLAGPGEILLDAGAASGLSAEWLIKDMGFQTLKGKSKLQKVYHVVGRWDDYNGDAENPDSESLG